jgi:hypothetical protein
MTDFTKSSKTNLLKLFLRDSLPQQVGCLLRPEVLHETQELACINAALELAYQRQIKPEVTSEILEALC